MFHIEILPNGNTVTVWDFPEPMCGDYPECHTEPPSCNC